MGCKKVRIEEKIIVDLKLTATKKEMQSHLPEFRMERAMGIEPTSLAWEAGILPMNYARTSLTYIL